jgi:hypothetical protein
MFKNPLKQEMSPVTPAEPAPQRKPAPARGGATPLTRAQTSSGVSPDALQAWRDKIRAATSDDGELLRLAHQMPGVELKLAAIEALTHEDAFRRAMREFRDQDKRLYRAARSGWQAASGKRKTAVEANALIASARALLEQELVPVNRVVELDREWAKLDARLLDAPLKAEFAALSSELGARVRASGEEERAITRWLPAVDSAIAQLRASLAGVAQGDLPPAAAATPAAALLELRTEAPDASDARCSEKTDAIDRTLALASSVTQRAEFLQALPRVGLIEEADEKAKIEQWRAIPVVSEAHFQSILADRFAEWRNACLEERQREHDVREAQAQEEKTAQKKERLAAVEREVAAAEAAQVAGRVAELTRLMTDIDQALKRGPVNPALGRRIESLHREQLRLRDWQRWSGRQGREQLVAEAQALAEAAAGKVAVKTHAEAIDKLRQRWKDLDKLGGATNQALWLAFDGALKTAYAPVAVHLDKLKAARAENLTARNQIIDGLVQAAARHFPVTPEGVAPPADAQPDWRAVARALEEAQVAWRKLGPVEHTVPRAAQQGEQAVAARYAAAAQALEKPLKEAWREAIGQREALVAAAKNLAGSQARDTIDKVRGLQAQWQAHAKALALPRRDENTLWAAFKTATDAVFAERDAARAARETEFSAKIKAREEIMERLAALPAGATAPEIKRAMAEAESAWRASAEVPKPHGAKLDARYRATRDAAAGRLAELASHASQARYDALIAAMALCLEREISGAEAASLDERWNAIVHLPDAWKATLEGRFRGTGSRSASQSGSSGSSKSGVKSGESLPDVLLYLEAACGIDSPAEFAAARQRLKLLRLKNAMEARRPVVTTPEDIERWLLDAAAMPGPDEISRERLAKVIAAVRQRQRK